MFRSAKTFVKKITLLTDPEPSFVSLVSGGANKSPFRSVKTEDDAMTILNSRKSDGLEFQSVIFKGDKFETADACHAWLAEGGVSSGTYDLTEEGVGFIAVSKADFLPETERVDYGDVSVIVGRLADPVQASVEVAGTVVAETSTKSETVAPDAPTSIVSSKKFDAYDAVYSSGTTVEEVITDSSRWSGIPIGYYELNAVLTTALDNALRDGAETAVVRQIVSDYADRLVLLAEASRGIPYAERTALFDSYGNRVKSEALKDEAAPEAVSEAVSTEAVTVEETVTETEIPAESTETVEADQAPVTEEAETGSAPAADIEAVEQAAVAKTDEVAEMKNALASLTGSIAELVSALKMDRENAEKLSARLERVENAGQTRKSATPDESVQVKKTQTIKVGGRGMSAFNGN
jgi:hypothetical protein